MADFWTTLGSYLSGGMVWGIVRALILIALGALVGRVLAGLATRVFRHSLDPHQTLLLRRVVFYLILGLAVASALHQLGFRLGVLLGAAGVLSVALAFASQTSASNLISGVFLLWERPFGVGDVIRVAGITGEILSVDPLSIKLRTFDNLFVRIPNETILKSEVTNLTRFPIRRLDMPIGVAYRSDIAQVREVLMGIADRDPRCLAEPEPMVMVLGFGDSAVNLQFSVWVRRENFLAVRTDLHAAILEAFGEAGIEIPFPHRSIQLAQGPMLPVRLEGGETSGG